MKTGVVRIFSQKKHLKTDLHIFGHLVAVLLVSDLPERKDKLVLKC